MTKKLNTTIYFKQARIMVFLLALLLAGAGQLAAQQATLIKVVDESFDNHGFLDNVVPSAPEGFNFGNFTYAADPSNVAVGECAFTKNSIYVGHPWSPGHFDHTTGGGYYLYAYKESGTSPKKVYSTTVSNVKKGEIVEISLYYCDVDGGYNFEIQATGTGLGDGVTKTSDNFHNSGGGWQPWSFSIKATQDGEVTFSIVDKWGYGDNAHKFGIDDIKVIKKAISVTTPISLTVRTTPGSQVPLEAEYSNPLQNSGESYTYKWQKYSSGSWITATASSGTATATATGNFFTTDAFSVTENTEGYVNYRLAVTVGSDTFYSDIITVEYISTEYIFKEDFGGNWVSTDYTDATNGASGDWWIMPGDEPAITTDFAYQPINEDACLFEMYGQKSLKSLDAGTYMISKLVGGTKSSTLPDCGNGSWNYGVDPSEFGSFPSMDDHTSEGDATKGYFMWAQSDGDNYKTVYSATIPVTSAMKGKSYVFGAYFMPSWGRNDGATDQLKMKVVGGSEISKARSFKSEGKERVWRDEEQLAFMIPSDYSGTEITISIQVKYGGFKFGLDDISLREYDTYANISSPQTSSEVGISVNFTVDYQHADSPIKYIWQKSDNAYGVWADITTGTVASSNGTFTTSIAPIEDGYYYRVLVTDGGNADYKTDAIISDPVRLYRGNYIFKEDFGGTTQSTDTSGDWWVAENDALAADLQTLYGSSYQYAEDIDWPVGDEKYGMSQPLILWPDRFVITKVSEVMYQGEKQTPNIIPNLKTTLFDATTSNGTGYYMISRCGWSLGNTVYSHTLDYMSAGNYAFNVCLAGATTDGGNEVKLTLKVETGGSTETVIVPITNENWIEYSVPFYTDGNSSVRISITPTGGNAGNASTVFGIDNISITDLRPQITYPDASEIFILAGESITLEGEYYKIFSLGSTIKYKWQTSANGVEPWTTKYESVSITNDDNVTIAPCSTGPITSTVYYRLLIVGEDGITEFESASVKITPAGWPESKTYWVCPDNMLDDEIDYLPSLIAMELPDLYVQYKWYDTDGVTLLSDRDKYKDGQTAKAPIPPVFESDGKSNTMSVLNQLSVNSGGVFTDREYFVEILDKATGLPYPGREEKISVFVSRSYICASAEPVVSQLNSGLSHRENFGGTDPNDPLIATDPLPHLVIDYPQYTENDDNLPEGSYMLTKKSPSLNGSGWTPMLDHVYDYDNGKHGYSLVVNANEKPGRLYTHQMTHLGACRNIELVFAAWFASPVNWEGDEKANLKFTLTNTETGKVLSEFITGNITDREHIWRQYGFRFYIPEDVTSITLEVINNNFGTAGGNDVLIDDVEIYLAIPPVTLVPSGDDLVCSNSTSISLKGEYQDDGTLGKELDYRWEFKKDGTDTWTFITDDKGEVIGGGWVLNGTVTSTKSEYQIADFTVEHNGDYRLAVGQKGVFGSDFKGTPNYDCMAVSKSRHLELIDKDEDLPKPSLQGQTAFCYDDADEDGYITIENKDKSTIVDMKYYGYVWQLTGPNGTNSAIIERSGDDYDNSIVTGIKLKLADYAPGFYTIALTVFNKADCSYYSTHEFLIYPEVTTWTANGDVENWNDWKNWDNGIPGECTDVIIPNKAMDITSNVELLGHYPLLKEPKVETLNSGTYQDDQDNLEKLKQDNSTFPLRPACDNIHFKMGGAVARTDYLKYTSANVDLDLKPDRWYTLSAPLQSMYSGDYYVEGHKKRRNPIVYMMKYNATNPQTQDTPAIATGDFSNPFNTLTEVLEPGLGFAVWVDDEKTTAEALQPFRFPRTEEKYDMWNYYGDFMGKTSTLDRSKKGRFIYEKDMDMDGNIPNAGITEFTVEVKEDKPTYKTMLVGNPFMAHLDFAAFAAANSGKISNGYYVWTPENVYIAQNPLIISDDPNEIAPMQSFIVQKSGTVNELTFTFDMAIAAPDPESSTSGGVLRSAPSYKNTILRLDVLRDSVAHSNIRLRYDPSESNAYDARKDMWTLFSETTTYPAVLYALVDGKAASIRTIGDLSKPIELGIRTTVTGLLTLQMSGLETLDMEHDLYLEDRLTGVIQNLRENSEYTFDNQTGNVQGRLFLRTDDGSDDDEDAQGDSNIHIFANGKQIRINSAPNDPIETVKVYSSQGNALVEKRSLNQCSFSMDLPVHPQVIIVSVTTRTQQKTEKLLIR